MNACADLGRLAARGLAVAVLALSGAGTAAAPAHATALTRTELAFVRSLNAVRANHGLAPIRIDADLTRASRAHTSDIAPFAGWERATVVTVDFEGK